MTVELTEKERDALRDILSDWAILACEGWRENKEQEPE